MALSTAAYISPVSDDPRGSGLRCPDSSAHRRPRYKREVNPWQHRLWCILPEHNAEFVCRMEALLERYSDLEDPRRLTVWLDEPPYQSVAETRETCPPRPGQPARVDHECRRGGTGNVFLCCQPQASWRHATVTERRTKQNFAEKMRERVDVHYPAATVIRVVLDNLNTQTGGAPYEAFAPAEARRLLRELEFHYTPKHGGWLRAPFNTSRRGSADR